MAKIVGDIAVSVGADVSGLQKGMNKGSKSVKRFEKNSEAMAKKFAKAGVAIATAATAAAAGIIAMAREAGKTGREIQTLSGIAGIGTTEFQKMAVAADTVLIGQEKLADIFKDVNDKFGDFVATGAGPLKDFFEFIGPAVGVTAEQFAALSGPEALQLYVSSLEKANLSQQEMTFYMEALASDATALLPLLKNGGAAMRDLGDEAQRAGRILDEDTIAGAVNVDDALQNLSRTLKTSSMETLIAYEDELLTFISIVQNDIIPGIAKLVGWFVTVTAKIRDGLDLLLQWRDAALDVVNPREPTELEFDPPSVEDYLGGIEPEPLKIEVNPVISSDITPIRPKETGGGGGGGGRNLSDDLEALRAQFATESELIQEEFALQLSQLEEFRRAKLGKEEEFNELEARIRKEHSEKMRAIDQAEMSVKLNAVQGAFGDLSALMSSSNKRLFEIGKGAAIASATISGYGAAVDAWAKGMAIGGPPVAAAFTGASLLKTGALIAGIASQQATGGGASVSAGGGSVATPAVESVQSQQVNVTLTGENFSIGSVQGLFEAINDGLGDGRQINLVGV